MTEIRSLPSTLIFDQGVGYRSITIANSESESEFNLRARDWDNSKRMPDWMIPLSEVHPRPILTSWVEHYNGVDGTAGWALAYGIRREELRYS